MWLMQFQKPYIKDSSVYRFVVQKNPAVNPCWLNISKDN